MQGNSLSRELSNHFGRYLIIAIFLHGLIFCIAVIYIPSSPPSPPSPLQVSMITTKNIKLSGSQNSNTALTTTETLLSQVAKAKYQNAASLPNDIAVVDQKAINDPAAKYIGQLQKYLEDYGNSHYPKQLYEDNITGELQLRISIHPNGNVNAVYVTQSSGNKLLDIAAKSLVQRAAPFEPFPQDLQHLTSLELVRTWHFQGK